MGSGKITGEKGEEGGGRKRKRRGREKGGEHEPGSFSRN